MTRIRHELPTKNDLEKYYVNEKLPMWKVAEILNASVGSVYNYLKRYELPRREPHKGTKGTHHTDKAKELISKAHKGKRLSEETKMKIAEALRIKGPGHRKKRGDGYIGLYYPSYPRSGKDGYVMEHIFVMEQSIGRPLKDDEVVHHINHIRDDNRLENLQLMTFKEHMSLHMKERWAKKKGEMTY